MSRGLTSLARRCHIDDCTEVARYKARLDWTEQPEVLLCVAHAAEECRWASVVQIDNNLAGKGSTDE